MATQLEELWDSAYRSYRAGRFGEAALQYEQARAAAERHGDRADAFAATVFAGEAWGLADKPLPAFERTLNALSAVPQDAAPYLVWIARKSHLSLIYNYFPDHAKLTAAWTLLKRYARETPGLPRSDLPHLEGNLLMSRGDFAAALACFEQGWSVHDGSGFYKWGFAVNAMDLNLWLGRRNAAARWYQLLGQAAQDSPTGLLKHALARARLARFDGDLAALEAAAVNAMDLAENTDFRDMPLAEMVRCRLLQPAYGDPAGMAHPARALLRWGNPRRRTVHEMYNRRLLILDYRLACLRFAAGVPAVEDVWCRTPQDLGAGRPAPGLTQAALARRIDQARQAGRRTLGYARYLDQCFACGWREERVRGRLARLETVTAVLAPFLRPRP